MLYFPCFQVALKKKNLNQSCIFMISDQKKTFGSRKLHYFPKLWYYLLIFGTLKSYWIHRHMINITISYFGNNMYNMLYSRLSFKYYIEDNSIIVLWFFRYLFIIPIDESFFISREAFWMIKANKLKLLISSSVKQHIFLPSPNHWKCKDGIRLKRSLGNGKSFVVRQNQPKFDYVSFAKGRLLSIRNCLRMFLLSFMAKMGIVILGWFGRNQQITLTH